MTPRIVRLIWATWEGSAGSGGGGGLRPSCSTLMTSSVAIRLANAPYACGPRRRAAAIVNPHVATFMIAIATAIEPPPRAAASDAAGRGHGQEAYARRPRRRGCTIDSRA